MILHDRTKTWARAREALRRQSSVEIEVREQDPLLSSDHHCQITTENKTDTDTEGVDLG